MTTETRNQVLLTIQRLLEESKTTKDSRLAEESAHTAHCLRSFLSEFPEN